MPFQQALQATSLPRRINIHGQSLSLKMERERRSSLRNIIYQQLSLHPRSHHLRSAAVPYMVPIRSHCAGARYTSAMEKNSLDGQLSLLRCGPRDIRLLHTAQTTPRAVRRSEV
jgi:hypothetical protein